MRVTPAFILYATSVAGELGHREPPELSDSAGPFRRAWHRLVWGNHSSSSSPAPWSSSSAPLAEPHDMEPAGWDPELPHDGGERVGRLVELEDPGDELAFAVQRDSDRERAGIDDPEAPWTPDMDLKVCPCGATRRNPIHSSNCPDELERTGRHFASSEPAPAPAEPTAWDAVAAFLAEGGERDVLAGELERVGDLLADLGQSARIILRMIAHDRRHREVRSPA